MVFQVYRLIGATVAKHGIEFVNAMVFSVFFYWCHEVMVCNFYIVYEDYLLIADIPDS